jgi:preprotein translocase subunit YajC
MQAIMPVSYPGVWQALLAQAEAPATGGEGLFATLMMFLPIIVLFYFMILRPQQKQEKLRRQLIGALKKNDRVLTASGIYGRVLSVDAEADRMTIRVASGVDLEMTRSSVVRVLEEGAERAAAEPAKGS